MHMGVVPAAGAWHPTKSHTPKENGLSLPQQPSPANSSQLAVGPHDPSHTHPTTSSIFIKYYLISGVLEWFLSPASEGSTGNQEHCDWHSPEE